MNNFKAFDSNRFGAGAVLGCDFAGVVEAVGSDVTRVSKGDTIAGLIWGGEIKGLGAYSEYTVADEAICFKVPANISLAQAATIPLAALTAWLGLFSKNSLDLDRSAGSDTTLVIWAEAFAALHGFKIVTTCSPRHFERVRSLGAKHAFDYRDANIVQLIKDAAPGLRYVFDAIGNETSCVLASQAIDEQGGTLCTIRPDRIGTENATKQTKITDVLVWTAFLKDHRLGTFFWPANEDDHKLAAEFCDKVPAWIEEGKFKPNDVKIIPSGLEGVVVGFQEYRRGKISAIKLVYEL
ncbi:hypothetical protein AK830_g9278 [Neonectria ditissima]|uniref:Enoyl reductase (ER) domain-containing protein n=1 Tax=Neonectria ditissima TaxID=78410 RepID=A0A0P7AS46_9HYPO|nr:hypothetical protein AK830_g9278 [Neonectria ditissima]